MPKVCIVYHSGFGHTEFVAKAVARGVEQTGIQGQLIKISAEGKIQENEWQDLENAQGIIFGTPTYMGGASAQFKIFADSSSKAWFNRKWVDKLAGGFTNSGSLSGDKLTTLQYLSVFASQHGMLWISNHLLTEGKNDNNLNRMGSWLGVMAQSDNAPASETNPPQGDIRTAEEYGKRVAEAVKRWNK
ncbi:MAG: flavodoxin family protein [Sphingobacteriia bacterium]|nr:flavodoxin family protein [Sphingobacteriia bacterium]